MFIQLTTSSGPVYVGLDLLAQALMVPDPKGGTILHWGLNDPSSSDLVVLETVDVILDAVQDDFDDEEDEDDVLDRVLSEEPS